MGAIEDDDLGAAADFVRFAPSFEFGHIVGADEENELVVRMGGLELAKVSTV